MLAVILYTLSFLFVHFIVSKTGVGIRHKANIESLYAFIALSLFFGFRDVSVLNDTSSYYEYMHHLSKFPVPFPYSDSYERFESGFQVFANVLSQFICQHPYFLIFSSAIIITISNILFYRTYTYSICLIIFFLITSHVLTSEYSGMRQGLAICILMYAYVQFNKNKLYKFIFVTLCASTFHSSAVVFLSLLIFKKFSLTKKNIILVAIIGIIFCLFLNKIVGILDPTKNIYVETSSQRSSIALAAILNTILALVLLIYCYIIKRVTLKGLILNYKYQVLWWISIMNVIFNASAIFIQVMTRFSLYFYPFVFLLLIQLISELKRNNNKVLLILIISVIFFIRFIVILWFRNGWNVLYPYKFYSFL